MFRSPDKRWKIHYFKTWQWMHCFMEQRSLQLHFKNLHAVSVIKNKQVLWGKKSTTIVVIFGRANRKAVLVYGLVKLHNLFHGDCSEWYVQSVETSWLFHYFCFLEESSCLNFLFFLPGGNTVCGPSVVSKRKANENGIYLFTHFHLKSTFYGKWTLCISIT